MKLRPLTDLALDPDAAAVSFYKMFGDGKPQPGAPNFARTGNVNAVKSFEDAGLVRLRNADARVGDREYDFGAVR